MGALAGQPVGMGPTGPNAAAFKKEKPVGGMSGPVDAGAPTDLPAELEPVKKSLLRTCESLLPAEFPITL